MASPLTGEYQVGLGTLVFGYDTAAPEVSLVKVNGLGPVVVPQTAPRALAPGAAVGVDVSGSRMVELDVEIFTPGDDESAGEWWADLADAFDAMETGLGSLYVWFPGIGHRELVGRPRGTTDDGLVSLPYGYIVMTLRWECTAGTLGDPIVEEP